MKFLVVILILTINFSAGAQNKLAGIDSSWYFLQPTTPPYGLHKIQELIRKATTDSSYFTTQVLDGGTYSSLSLREKFTYNMINPESFYQICSVFGPNGKEKKPLPAYLAALSGSRRWSERQTKFFINNKDTVIQLMTACLQAGSNIGPNFKHVIVDINAKAMIPFVLKAYEKNESDLNLLTVLMLLMKDNKYRPFINSALYKNLYDYENGDYRMYIDLDAASEKLITTLATQFYNEQHK
jgi:hypothetical protein